MRMANLISSVISVAIAHVVAVSALAAERPRPLPQRLIQFLSADRYFTQSVEERPLPTGGGPKAKFTPVIVGWREVEGLKDLKKSDTVRGMDYMSMVQFGNIMLRDEGFSLQFPVASWAFIDDAGKLADGRYWFAKPYRDGLALVGS